MKCLFKDRIHSRQFGRKAVAFALTLLFVLSNFTYPFAVNAITIQPAAVSREASQMADVLGITPQLNRLEQLRTSSNPADLQESLALKSLLLQKLLTGYVEVRRATDRSDRELNYSYYAMRKAARRQDLINECFTLANFAQLSTLYTTEPFLRLDKHFRRSAICTQTGGGTGILLAVSNIAEQKMARTRKTAPPDIMSGLVEGGPVDGAGLPFYVQRFLDSPAADAVKTRRAEMYELWVKRYGVDPNNKATLCPLNNDDPKTMFYLHKRILLLWSLHTYILNMDQYLLSLLKQIQGSNYLTVDNDTVASATINGVTAGGAEASRLLKIQSFVSRLIDANKKLAAGGLTPAEAADRQSLEIFVLEKVLAGALEVRVASDQVDSEINYASDVVLAELLAKRGKALQKNYEANFIQAGTFGSVAGLLYLKHITKVGNEMFVISGGIGTGLSILALRLMRGGSRQIDTHSNELADMFNLPSQDEYRFSPLIAGFLNSKEPTSKAGLSRRDELIQYWKEEKITTVNLTRKKVQSNLSSVPGAKPDTIKIVANRLAMLRNLLARIELLDAEMLDLLRATDAPGEQIAVGVQPTDPLGGNGVPKTELAGQRDSSSAEAEHVLGISREVDRSFHLKAEATSGSNLAEVASLRTSILRKVLTAALDVRSMADVLDNEVAYESDVLDRMVRLRTHVIAVTNNINFFQLNILACIIDGPLGLSGNSRHVRASNMLNIASGLMVGGLALATVLEEHGGFRPLPAYPNTIGQCLNMADPAEYRFSPIVWKFINSVPPGSKSGQTRVQQMTQAWKQAKTISVNMERQKVREQIAVRGSYSQHKESIKLIKNRLDMLRDVRGTIVLFDGGLDDLLLSVS